MTIIFASCMIYFFNVYILLYGGVIGGDKLWTVSKFGLDNRNYRPYGITWIGKQCSDLILEWTLVKGRSSWPQAYFIYLMYLKWKYIPLTQIKMWKWTEKETNIFHNIKSLNTTWVWRFHSKNLNCFDIAIDHSDY